MTRARGPAEVAGRRWRSPASTRPTSSSDGASIRPRQAPGRHPGIEIAGTVAELGEGVTDLELDSRVMAVVGGGGQAERCVVRRLAPAGSPGTRSATSKPVASPRPSATAHDALVSRGRLAAGMRVLVTGAAGGVGTAAVQIGAAVGAEVIASRARPGSTSGGRGPRGGQAIDPSEVAEHGPYDVVLELVGASSLAGGLLGALALEARVVVIGVGGGARLELDLLSLMNARASIAGATLRSRSRQEKAAVALGVRRDLLVLLASGSLRVPILEQVALEDAPAGYERFAAGSKLGKIVLRT